MKIACNTHEVDPRWLSIEEKIMKNLMDQFYTNHKIDYGTIDAFGLTKEENERMFIKFLTKIDLTGAVELLVPKERILYPSGIRMIRQAYNYSYISPFHGLE